jgi:hypothetical protein
MSGKIRILNADGTAFTPTANPAELPLYSVHEVTPVDNVCGTSGLEPYSFGEAHACSERYICGDLNTDFEKCLDAMNCEMKTNMHSYTTADHSDKIAVFMQQMIPHHKNAINMAKSLLKQAPAADIYAAYEDPEAPDDNGLENILYDIISVQSYQVHQFRNYLGALDLLPSDPNPGSTPTPAPTPKLTTASTATPTPTPTPQPKTTDVSDSTDSSATLLALSAVGLALSI